MDARGEHLVTLPLYFPNLSPQTYLGRFQGYIFCFSLAASVHQETRASSKHQCSESAESPWCLAGRVPLGWNEWSEDTKSPDSSEVASRANGEMINTKMGKYGRRKKGRSHSQIGFSTRSGTSTNMELQSATMGLGRHGETHFKNPKLNLIFNCGLYRNPYTACVEKVSNVHPKMTWMHIQYMHVAKTSHQKQNVRISLGGWKKTKSMAVRRRLSNTITCGSHSNSFSSTWGQKSDSNMPTKKSSFGWWLNDSRWFCQANSMETAYHSPTSVA